MKGENSKAGSKTGSKGQTTSAGPRKLATISKQGTRQPANNNGTAPGKAKGQGTGKRRSAAPERLFTQMSASQIRAAERIMLGFRLRTVGLGFRTQSFSRMPTSSGNSGAWHLELMRGFVQWAARMQEQGLSVTAALDILVFGKSCRAVDKARRKRNGFAKENLMKSLYLFECEFL
ncbi:hypothetical protein NBZ79_12225 [Sneathiella marina]|uniref:Uncharacterized protein n=1 Tax=Sneathiella marina TaxID=2950108 RepID=A0ABY4VYN2_9PROT|nr:hypothetical protein [Sneathiella marina]USG59943.1 hypothetical protein NBZ79_12225 [Sneathiella marina]